MQEKKSGIEDALQPKASGALGANLAEQVRLLRAKRRWPLKRLSEQCGVSQSMLSQIERGEANPTIVVALAIARAFSVTLDELVMGPDGSPPFHIIRADDPHYIYRSDPDCRIRTLSPLTADQNLEFYEITLQRGGALHSAPHFAGTRENLTVLRGQVSVKTGGHVANLSVGDSISYPADVTHDIINAGSAKAVVYLIDTIF